MSSRCDGDKTSLAVGWASPTKITYAVDSEHHQSLAPMSLQRWRWAMPTLPCTLSMGNYEWKLLPNQEIEMNMIPTACTRDGLQVNFRLKWVEGLSSKPERGQFGFAKIRTLILLGCVIN